MPWLISFSSRGRSAGSFSRCDHRLRAAFVRPRRDDAGQVVLPGAIGIDVRLHVLPARARLRDGRRQLRHLAPHLVLGDLQVDDVHRHVRRAGRSRSPPPPIRRRRGLPCACGWSRCRRIATATSHIATSVSVSIHDPGGPLSELATPSAPCSIASLTSARISVEFVGGGRARPSRRARRSRSRSTRRRCRCWSRFPASAAARSRR